MSVWSRDIQHSDTQHNGCNHNSFNCDTTGKGSLFCLVSSFVGMLIVITVGVIILNVVALSVFLYEL